MNSRENGIHKTTKAGHGVEREQIVESVNAEMGNGVFIILHREKKLTFFTVCHIDLLS